ncbi:hypothetical protein P280DRAFT_548911 [Massarina eburnea CBS 473.64]|uniref:Uncharacterized protein n=1 Tax=Massarina eburnea CBS 473.64 TaxID=1395130 RepID=A0A6A6S016_9PLEO|nr:hypothetical protein P280DRAFT_548911 [Massarina eburnea CBS 473.64]
MKSSFFTTALGLAISVQAFPAPGKGATAAADTGAGAATASNQGIAQMLQALQASGAQSLTAKDLTSLLNTLLSGSGAATGATGAGAETAAGGKETGATAGKEEEENKNEVNLTGVFGKATALEGGDIKQDVLFSKSTVGSFEFEFSNKVADQVTVAENQAPTGTAPTGFEFLEKSTYAVSLGTSKGVGLTLSKIDYIFDTTSAGLQGKDIAQSKVGRLCPETGAFVISDSIGEVEFEADENEVTLNLNKNVTAQAEWGIFIPVASAAAAQGATAAAGKNATAAVGSKATGGTKATTGAATGKKNKADKDD